MVSLTLGDPRRHILGIGQQERHEMQDDRVQLVLRPPRLGVTPGCYVSWVLP